VLAKCAEELQCWFRETPLVRLCGRLCSRRCGHSEAHAGAGTCAADDDRGSFGTSSSSSASADVATAAGTPSMAPEGSPLAGAAASQRHQPGGGAAPGPTGQQARAAPGAAGESAQRTAPGVALPKGGFPARAICRHLYAALLQLRHDIQVMLFLAFPRGSPFRDRTVEALFQWHYTRRLWLCLDWSTLALLFMLVWDVAMNPPYRVTLILLFYSAFGAGLLLRKVMLFAAPSPPRHRRVWHNVLLCAFFFGRCVVCQPLLVSLAREGARPFRALQVEAFSSVIGLGMTNLSMVFMQQMQTIDMLLFCLVNGVVFILWIIFVLQMPLTDALHTAYVGSIVVTAVCVRQQRDLEDIERRTFDYELLHARGMLVRSADRIAAQATRSDFASAMQVLSRARRVEHLNL